MTDACPILPNEPRIADREKAQALTEQWLIPNLQGITTLFGMARNHIDKHLQAEILASRGKPYPIGRCLEISLAVSDHLNRLQPSSLKGLAAEGHAALQSFLTHGGTIRQVWGDLRGEYFQNAFLAGTLYIDVANDTVVATKPKIEILPFEESGLRPIEDYLHFSRIASRYWQAETYPNNIIPGLAPLCPVITVSADYGIQLQSITAYMQALTVRNGFRTSTQALNNLQPMEDRLFNILTGKLASMKGSWPVAIAPLQGLEHALQACHEAGKTGQNITHQLRDTVISMNRQLAREPGQAYDKA